MFKKKSGKKNRRSVVLRALQAALALLHGAVAALAGAELVRPFVFVDCGLAFHFRIEAGSPLTRGWST